TTSAAQQLILSSTGNIALTITSIAVTGTNSGDFAQSNTCGSSVAAGSSCMIGVTFTPTAAGNRSASVTITDNAAESPQTVILTGNGQDFSMAASTPTSATVSPGEIATFGLSVVPQGGFNQSVSFTCVGAPAQSLCVVSPSS